MSEQAELGVAPLGDSDFVIGKLRVLTTSELRFFHVACEPTPMANLDPELNRLMPLLESAQVEAGIAAAGTVVTRYYPVEDSDLYVLEVGVPVKPEVLPAGEAKIKTLAPLRCAALLYWGSLEHIGDAYGALIGALREAGMVNRGEGREWYYHFEGDVSPHNVIELQLEVVSGA